MKSSLNIYFQNTQITLSFLLAIIIGPNASAQLRIDKVTPPSFNAAAIIKYSDHPIGTKYGVPKIKFPIKTLINDDLYIPISLNYHAMGIKVEEESTWAGLGWYMSSGGMITRIIRGENDFGVIENKDGTGAKGYPFEHIKPCFDDCEENENADFHKKVCDGEIDSDPDIFFFDILGARGKFLLTPDNDPYKRYIEIRMVSPRRISVRYFIAENYWEAEDEFGFKFTFKAREVTESFDNYFDYKFDSHSLHFLNDYKTATTTWYLTSVESAKGAIASFIYDITPYGTSRFASNSTHHKMNINDSDIWDLHYPSYCFPEDIENVQIVSESRHQDIYLKSIFCGEYAIHFRKSEQEIVTPSKIKKDEEYQVAGDIEKGFGSQQLDKIVIKKDDQIIESNSFFYSYFNEETYGEESHLYQRLRLDSLSTVDGDKQKGYKFSYENEITLPSKESHARDMWGYYNGEEDLYNITPSDFFNYSQPEKLLQEDGKTKHYDLNYIKAAILKKVDYGNGRTKEFTYDHQEFELVDEEISSHFTKKMKDSNFSHHLNPFIFGGLRVKEIVDSFPSEKIYKKFNYMVNGKDTGKLTITHYNHSHHGYGHKTSGNHCVKYKFVNIKTGKLFGGKKF